MMMKVTEFARVGGSGDLGDLGRHTGPGINRNNGGVLS